MKSNPKNDQYWMNRALRLATRGLGKSSPNPSVAACIVKDGVCIGEGVHQECGSDHAEIIALKNAAANGHDPRGACIYITLAPCTTHGRTPPCTSALIESGIKRVVVAVEDPHQGDASEILEEAGIEYVSVESDFAAGGIASHVHGGFFKRMQTGLPRITGKWAMTIDGYVACHTMQSHWISNLAALALSRRRRRIYDAIVVGSRTVQTDDPRLMAVDSSGRTPRRVVLAGSTIPDFSNGQLLKDHDLSPVMCFHRDEDIQRQKAAIDHGIILKSYNSGDDVVSVFEALAAIGCNDVLVEGGSQIHQQMLSRNLYDRLEVYIGHHSIGGGYSVAGDRGVDRIDLGSNWALEQAPLTLGDCVCLRYRQVP